MKDHWGVNVLMGYQKGGGSALCYETRELRPDVWSKEVGFDVINETRSIWVGQIQEWIASFRAGTQYARCWSRAVFETLLDTELDDRGLVVAGPGIAHGEDFVLRGQTLRRIHQPEAETPQAYDPPPPEHEVKKQVGNRLASIIRSGEDVEEEREPEDWLAPRMERPR